MAEICKVCGAEMPDEVLVCPNCGSTGVQEPEAPKKKVKWWMIVVPIVAVILAASLVVLILWDAIYIRIAPTAVLGEAIGNTVTELSARPAGTPLEALSGVVDDEGKYTVELDMALDYEDYMTMDASIVAQNDLTNFQSQVDLDANVSLYSYITLDVNMGIYGDREQMAANWEQIFGQDYYGIAYETFGEDARSNTLVYDALGEEVVAELEEYFSLYRTQMDTLAEHPEELAFSGEYAQILLEFIQEHKPAVTTEKRPLSGVEQKCYVLTYTVASEALAALVERLLEVFENDQAMEELFRSCNTYAETIGGVTGLSWEETWADILESYGELADTIRDTNSTCTVSFSLYEKEVVYLDVAVVSDESEVAFSLTLGDNPAENDIVLTYEFDTADDAGTLELTLSTRKDENAVEERLSIVLQDEYDDVDMSLGYTWDRGSGDFTVTTEGTANGDDMAFQLDLLLYEEGEGFTVELPDLFDVISATDPEMAGYYEGMSFGIRCSLHPGAEIIKPEYINIKELDEDKIGQMEDNLTYHYGMGY